MERTTIERETIERAMTERVSTERTPSIVVSHTHFIQRFYKLRLSKFN